MTDRDPYAYSPDAESNWVRDQPKPKQSLPSSAVAICAVCLVLPILGYLGSCLAFASPLFLGFWEGMIQSMPEADREQQQRALDQAKNEMFVGMAFAAINLFVATSLLAGSIGTFRKKLWGLKTLRIATAAAAAFVLIRYTVSMAISFMATQPDNKDIPEHLKNAENFGNVFGIILGTAIVLLLISFYVGAFIYLGKKSVRDAVA